MSKTNSLTIVILAAGEGTRMNSDMPKVLHKIASKPMLSHVIETAQNLDPTKICIIASPKNKTALKAVTGAYDIFIQTEQLGTGHAVQSASSVFNHGDTVLVLYGDGPLYDAPTLQRFIDQFQADQNAGLGFLGMHPDNPYGYGRMITDSDGYVLEIVEEKDASEDQKNIDFCWTGVMCADASKLEYWLTQIGNENAKGEYYLTDLPSIALKDGTRTLSAQCPAEKTLGANTRAELTQLEKKMQENLRQKALDAGVTLIDPNTVYFASDTKIGKDVVIEPNVFFGPGVEIADNVHIKAFSHIEGAKIGKGTVIGPFARLRPGTVLDEEVKIGNFVEVKNANFAKGTKANHLAYIGDATLGEGSNIGAGTITCNYDGFDKHQTKIGDGVFVGSNTTLVAPVTLENGSFVAAGSVITKNVPQDALAVARNRVILRDGWANSYRQKKST